MYKRKGLIKPCNLEFDLEISIICIIPLLKIFPDPGAILKGLQLGKAGTIRVTIRIITMNWNIYMVQLVNSEYEKN